MGAPATELIFRTPKEVITETGSTSFKGLVSCTPNPRNRFHRLRSTVYISRRVDRSIRPIRPIRSPVLRANAESGAHVVISGRPIEHIRYVYEKVSLVLPRFRAVLSYWCQRFRAFVSLNWKTPSLMSCTPFHIICVTRYCRPTLINAIVCHRTCCAKSLHNDISSLLPGPSRAVTCNFAMSILS